MNRDSIQNFRSYDAQETNRVAENRRKMIKDVPKPINHSSVAYSEIDFKAEYEKEVAERNNYQSKIKAAQEQASDKKKEIVSPLD